MFGSFLSHANRHQPRPRASSSLARPRASFCSLARPRARFDRARRVGSYLLLSVLGLGSTACELFLDIPEDDWQPPDAQVQSDAAAADASSDDLDAAPLDASEASVPDEVLDASGDGDDLDADVLPRDAGPVVEEDASVDPPMDSGTPGKVDASVPKDAGPEPKDAAVPCTLSIWYADDDGDGEGNSAKTSKACVKPAGKWVDHGGDCSDADARAHHGQNTYYGTPFKNAAGQDSFDFNCSGQEEPWAGQPLTPACNDSFNCKGSGYAIPKTTRPGTGVYAYCGSLTQTTCKLSPLLLCGPTTQTVTDPFLCR